MLLQFRVKNFKSIRDEAVLSLSAASSDPQHPDNFVTVGKDLYLRMAAVYGANASGKSNLFVAMTTAILAVRRSNDRQVGEPISQIIPFMFDKETANAPTSFEFIFTTDGLKYVYGFSATRQEIETEYLYVYKSAKASTIFERERNNTPEYHFTSPALKKQLQPITKRNTSNKLFLATATAWNCEATKAPLLWLTKSINTYSPEYNELQRISNEMYDHDEDQSLRHFTIRLLQEADINISDYQFESKELPQDELVNVLGVPKEVSDSIHLKKYDINTIHRIKTDDGENSFLLPLALESRGTINLFRFSPILKRAFETGETICIDEFDSSLHPTLVHYLVGLFHNPNVNRADAQLLISTHDVSLLNLKELRRDQIYFMDKDQDTGASTLYSLDEFSPRLNEDVRKAYLLGRYGSIPNIGDGESLWL